MFELGHLIHLFIGVLVLRVKCSLNFSLSICIGQCFSHRFSIGFVLVEA